MSVLQPGATLGVFGGGQLGRMFTAAAQQLGYRVHVYSPESGSPAGQVANLEFQAEYDDTAAIEVFAHGVDAVTFEFENVPRRSLDVAEKFVPVRPHAEILHTTRNRRREKTFLQQAGIAVAPFHAIGAADDLAAARDAQLPGVLKTAEDGYDGKGQVRVNQADELEPAWEKLGRVECVLEQFIDFDFEMSVIVARGLDGDIVTYGPIVNSHRNHILDISITPDGLPEKVTGTAVEIADTIAKELNLIGVLCVEFFVGKDGAVLVNELAPRPHNSGHLTIDAYETSQFEQQVRAVCGMPLGAARQLQPAAMANLLGDIWISGEPRWRNVLAQSGVKLHLYGKQEPRSGRKMGHLTALADNADAAAEKVRAARDMLVVRNSNDRSHGSEQRLPLQSESRPANQNA